MKIVTTFLAILVLGLSTQPMLMYDRLDSRPAVKKTCSAICAKKETKKKSAKKGCKDYCNPFMSCSGCLYTMTGITEFSLKEIDAITLKGEWPDNNDLDEYNADCWHPPRNC